MAREKQTHEAISKPAIPPTAKAFKVTRQGETHLSSFGQTADWGNFRAWRWCNSLSYHRCTDGSGNNADTYAAAHIGSAISAAS